MYYYINTNKEREKMKTLMRKFVEGPKPDYKIVNLDNVSNIAFEEYQDRDNNMKYKIIFNFNYGVSLNSNDAKVISDYVYYVYDTREEYDKMSDELSRLINEKMWIAPIINGNVSRIANPDKISFIATDPIKNRIILNLATTVSFYSNYDKMTSDFMYFDFSNKEEYMENLIYIKEQLKKVF